MDERKREEYEAKASYQERMILAWYNRYSAGKAHPPSYVYQELIDRAILSRKTPLTSVRRAMSNLTKAGLLVKTGIKIAGPYGRDEYCWRLV